MPRNTPTTLKRLQRISGDRRDLALDAGIVIEHVDGAELVDGGADIVGDFSLVADIGGHGKGFGRGGQILDRGLQILRLAVDRDDARPALGQQPHGGAADDTGRTGHDGDLAVQANSIGHAFPQARPVVPDFGGSAYGARTFRETTISCVARAGYCPGQAATRPFPAVFGVLTRDHASG
jgi:hypothetical protein